MADLLHVCHLFHYFLFQHLRSCQPTETVLFQPNFSNVSLFPLLNHGVLPGVTALNLALWVTGWSRTFGAPGRYIPLDCGATSQHLPCSVTFHGKLLPGTLKGLKNQQYTANAETIFIVTRCTIWEKLQRSHV